MEPEVSLPYSQDPATGTYHESDDSNTHIPVFLVYNKRYMRGTTKCHWRRPQLCNV
jgi:hypothetical protein